LTTDFVPGRFVIFVSIWRSRSTPPIIKNIELGVGRHFKFGECAQKRLTDGFVEKII
jgi:hypothetical protein